jgi:hypothetical protein
MGQERYGPLVRLARHCPAANEPGIFGRAKEEFDYLWKGTSPPHLIEAGGAHEV